MGDAAFVDEVRPDARLHFEALHAHHKQFVNASSRVGLVQSISRARSLLPMQWKYMLSDPL